MITFQSQIIWSLTMVSSTEKWVRLDVHSQARCHQSWLCHGSSSSGWTSIGQHWGGRSLEMQCNLATPRTKMLQWQTRCLKFKPIKQNTTALRNIYYICNPDQWWWGWTDLIALNLTRQSESYFCNVNTDRSWWWQQQCWQQHALKHTIKHTAASATMHTNMHDQIHSPNVSDDSSE